MFSFRRRWAETSPRWRLVRELCGDLDAVCAQSHYRRFWRRPSAFGIFNLRDRRGLHSACRALRIDHAGRFRSILADFYRLPSAARYILAVDKGESSHAIFRCRSGRGGQQRSRRGLVQDLLSAAGRDDDRSGSLGRR